MVRRAPAWFRQLLCALIVLVPGAAQAACEDVLPAGADIPADFHVTRRVRAEDIVRLRDIGPPDAALVPPASPLAISPDGRRLAFVISRAAPERNDYCRALVVLDAHGGGAPRIVDRGGEHMMLSYALRGLMVHPGYPDLVVPAWSPDGSKIAYRKRLAGKTQAWIAAADGSGARPVGAFAGDVEAVGWSADGTRLIAVLRPGLTAQKQALASEGQKGFLYDGRFAPNDADRPALTGPEPRAFFAISPRGSWARRALPTYAGWARISRPA